MRRGAQNLPATTGPVEHAERVIGDQARSRPDLRGEDVGARDGAPSGLGARSATRWAARAPAGGRAPLRCRQSSCAQREGPTTCRAPGIRSPPWDSPVPSARRAAGPPAARRRVSGDVADASTAVPRGAGASGASCPGSRWWPTPAGGRGPGEVRAQRGGGADHR